MFSSLLYPQRLLDLAKDTRYQRGLADVTHDSSASNPFCGDKIKIELVIKNDKIIDIGCTVDGCVVLKASTNFLANEILNLDKKEALNIIERLLADVHKDPSNFWSKIAKNPRRAKCVTLPWHVVLDALTNTEEAVIKILKTVRDPELPVNIYDLGLIYDVKEENDYIEILMTLTTPNCPVADSFPGLVETTVKEKLGTDTVKVALTFDPPWTLEKATPDARILLGH